MVHKSKKSLPLSEPLEKAVTKRATAQACRDKAVENLAIAVSKPTGDQRQLLERAAAAWNMLATQLQRQESRLAAELLVPGSEVDHVRF